MADYSGTISSDVTWYDGDTFGSTNNVTVNAGVTVTINPGATIRAYDGRYVNLSGTFTSIGTESSIISFKSQSADPGEKKWWGFYTGNNTAVWNFTYTYVENAQYFIHFVDKFTSTANINKVWASRVSYLFYGNTLTTQPVNWNIQNVYADFIISNVFPLNGGGISQNLTISRVYLYNSHALTYPTNWKGTGIIFSEWVMKHGSGGFEGNGTNHTIQDCYLSQITNSCTATISAACSVVFQRNVCYKTEAATVVQNEASSTTTSSYNDLMDGTNYALSRGGGTLSSDNDYVAGNLRRPSSVIDISYNTQVNGTMTRTNARNTPNKPLSVSNIVAGSPTSDSITITFDCAEGSSGNRLYGIGFIKYGTTSGIYTMQSFVPDEQSLPLYWINWKTTGGVSFKQTGHSVTLSNLKPGTTYYYKCCFIDPLGRLAESSEDSFTTTDSSVYPSESDVRQAVTYGPTGTEYTGNVVLPLEAVVRESIQYGANGTEYTGNDVLPSEGNVRVNVYYGSEGTEFVGVFAYPEEEYVLDGIDYGAYGEFTGNYVVPEDGKIIYPTPFGPNGGFIGISMLPEEVDVREGIGYGSGGSEYYGRISLPSDTDVRKDVSYGADKVEFTGNIALPTVDDVKKDIQYGANGTEYTGTLESTDPGEENVLKDINYKIENVDKVGTFDESLRNTDPGEENVLKDVSYKIQNVDKVGTLDESLRNTDPGIANVLKDISYKIQNVSKMGTFDESARNTDPGIANVLKDVSYKIQNVSKTGTLDESSRNTDPGIANVLKDISYKIQNVDKVGAFDESSRNTDPGIANVKKNVSYKIQNVDKVGTLDTSGASTDPGENNVRDGITYRINNVDKEGNVVLPIESTVKKNTQYGSNGSEYIGTYDPTTSAPSISGVECHTQ